MHVDVRYDALARIGSDVLFQRPMVPFDRFDRACMYQVGLLAILPIHVGRQGIEHDIASPENAVVEHLNSDRVGHVIAWSCDHMAVYAGATCCLDSATIFGVGRNKHTALQDSLEAEGTGAMRIRKEPAIDDIVDDLAPAAQWQSQTCGAVMLSVVRDLC